jgi:ABC-type transport system substrate-binding protein
MACCTVVACLAVPICHAATEKKTLRSSFRVAETGFDPARNEDRYSVGIMESIFEPLLTYDYLARPLRLVPLTAQAVPEPENDGTVYTFHIRPGIYFADDPVFKGQRRELTARDYEYAIKRFRDPRLRPPYEFLFEGNIIGLDEVAAEGKKINRFNYDARVEGLQVVDRYTLRIKLKSPDYNFLYVMAMSNVVAVAREVIEAYNADSGAHPVGTGPFMLAEWIRRSRIVLERNPGYRGHVLDTRFADPADEWDRAAMRELENRTLPLLDRVEISIIEEEQPRYLAFINREHDILEEMPYSFITQVMPNGKLAPGFAKAGVRVFNDAQMETTYDAFNLDDPVVGGYSPAKVALRRAMVLGHNRDEEIRIIRKGQAIPAQSAVPPGVIGYDPAFQTADVAGFNPAKARALLDMYGYVDTDGDGFRETPDGKPLVVKYYYASGTQENRQLAELWSKSMAAIGIRVDPIAGQWADLLRDSKAGKLMMAGAAWIADFPDAQNFLQLLYGPHTGQSNRARFKLPEYDRLYEKSIRLKPGTERDAVYREMTRLALAYAPWRFGVHRTYQHLVYPWVKGYKHHPLLYTNFKYLDIDVMAQKAAIAN